MYSKQDKTPANWVKSFTIDNNVTVSVSDKGSIMLRHTDNNRFIMCLQPTQATMLCNIAGDLGNILQSEEYQAINEDKAKAKLERELAKQVAAHAEKAKRVIQAALDQLKLAGFSEEQAKAMLKVG